MPYLSLKPLIKPFIMWEILSESHCNISWAKNLGFTSFISAISSSSLSPEIFCFFDNLTVNYFLCLLQGLHCAETFSKKQQIFELNSLILFFPHERWKTGIHMQIQFICLWTNFNKKLLERSGVELLNINLLLSTKWDLLHPNFAA